MYGENFPYSNFHELNMDWIVKIAKDFLEQYTHIQELIQGLVEDGKTEIEELTETELAELQAKAEEFETLLQEWYETHSADIAGQLATAISTFDTHALNKEQQILDSLPDDYTELSTAVTAIEQDKDAILSELIHFENTQQFLLERGNFQRGIFNPNTEEVVSAPYRITARKAIVFPFDVHITAKSGFRFYPHIYNDSTHSWIGTEWKTSWGQNANVPFYCQIGRTTEDTTETADISEFVEAITVTGKPVNNLGMLNVANIEQGVWAYGTKVDSNYRLRVTELVPVQKGENILYDAGSMKIAFCYMTSSSASTWAVIWKTGSGRYIVPDNGVMAINISKIDETLVAPHEFDGVILNPHGLAKTIIGSENYNANLPEITNGKNLYIYHFGGKGNDWCFVRTPPNYNHFNKANPFPFVICCHGNGWVMDGTEQYANWTKRTMYVPLNDPDYIADPTEYNGTSDQSLWYSNPTIETLLNAGYIVCGCENYGDLLFGNNDCRNACVDFFYHMVNFWNVQDRCYMIGASNGALTCLNASYILQGRVRAMVLQYPITCLVNQYVSNQSHQAWIRTAYGISNASITPTELAKAVATHDPLTTDVVNDIKVGTVPPISLYYSPDDPAVLPDYNSIPFAELLDDSNKVVETTVCSGGHGDHTHFDPDAFLHFFNVN